MLKLKKISYKDVLKAKTRDYLDKTRKHNPLKKTEFNLD